MGLLRMKALAHPRWVEEVAQHDAVYFVEASRNNAHFGAGCDFENLYKMEMSSLGHNYLGSVLDTINDEHRGAVIFVASTLPAPGSLAVPWEQLERVSPQKLRRRDLSERAKFYRGEEGSSSRSKRARAQSPAPPQGPWVPRPSGEADGQSASWGTPPQSRAGHMATMARRSLSPHMQPQEGYWSGGHGGMPQRWTQPANSDRLNMHGPAYGAAYGPPYGYLHSPPPPEPRRHL